MKKYVPKDTELEKIEYNLKKGDGCKYTDDGKKDCISCPRILC